MRSRLRAVSRLGLVAVARLGSLAFAPAVAAHGGVAVGEYHLTIGWMNEPTFAGQPNGVEVTIEDHDESPVVDLAADALSVVVSTGGQDAPRMPLTPAFSIEGGFGTPGQYTADLIPTVPGEYTFHFTGAIHDQEVDVTITSGEDTFSGVNATTDLEFPVKVPTMVDVATRLDRIDGRIEQLQAGAISPQQLADLQTAINAARTEARDAASTGRILGGAGLLVGAIALIVARRAGRRGIGSA